MLHIIPTDKRIPLRLHSIAVTAAELISQHSESPTRPGSTNICILLNQPTNSPHGKLAAFVLSCDKCPKSFHRVSHHLYFSAQKGGRWSWTKPGRSKPAFESRLSNLYCIINIVVHRPRLIFQSLELSLRLDRKHSTWKFVPLT